MIFKTAILWAFIASTLLVTTGFFREFIFVNINEQLRFLYYGSDESYLSPHLELLTHFTYNQLYYLKWILTVVFSLVFLFESSWLVKSIFGGFYLKELTFIYALLFLVSASLYIPFFIAGNVEQGYILARFFMGIAQSPLPVMLLIPAVFLRHGVRAKT